MSDANDEQVGAGGRLTEMTQRFQGYSEEFRVARVDEALALMAADETVSAKAAATAVAKEHGISADSVMRWSQRYDKPLAKVGFNHQRQSAARSKFYARGRREQQRMRLMDLIDSEMEQTYKQLSGKRAKEDATNFAQRINALASAHGTVASHSRQDELHALRMGDIDPLNPKDDLDEWDGDPKNLPDGLSDKILNIAETRQRAEQLKGP